VATVTSTIEGPNRRGYRATGAPLERAIADLRTLAERARRQNDGIDRGKWIRRLVVLASVVVAGGAMLAEEPAGVAAFFVGLGAAFVHGVVSFFRGGYVDERRPLFAAKLLAGLGLPAGTPVDVRVDLRGPSTKLDENTHREDWFTLTLSQPDYTLGVVRREDVTTPRAR
jgi:hypothetical protein